MRKLLVVAFALLLCSVAIHAEQDEDFEVSESLAELAAHSETADHMAALQHAASEAELEGGMPRLIELLESILADWKKGLASAQGKYTEEDTKCTNNAKSIADKIKASNDKITSKTATITEQRAAASAASATRDRKSARKTEVDGEISKQNADLSSRTSKLTTDLADKDAEIDSYNALIDFLKSMQKEIKDGGLIETQALEMLNNKVAQMAEQHQAAMSLASLLAKAAGDYDMDDVKELIALMIDELNKAIKDAQDTKVRYTANYNERKVAIETVIKGFNEEKAVLEKEIAEQVLAIASANAAADNAQKEKDVLANEVKAFDLEQTANTDACTRTKGDLQKDIDHRNKKIAVLEKILNAVKNANNKTAKKLLDVVKDVDISVPRWVVGDWSQCSVSCGTGTRTRTVKCDKSARSLKECKGDAPATSQTCVMNPCPVNCEVSAWGPYSGCSASCGGGVQTRTRTVVKNAANGGTACPALSESTSCNSQACPVSSYIRTLGWGDWCGAPYYTSGRVRIFDQEMSQSRGINIYLARGGGRGTVSWTNSDTYAHEVTPWGADNNVIGKLDEWLNGQWDVLAVTYFDEATNQMSRNILDKLAAAGCTAWRNAGFRSAYICLRTKSRVLRDEVGRGNACVPLVDDQTIFL